MSKSPPPKKLDFAKELKELEAIVEWFETGEVDLDQALAKFERGMEVAQRLKHYLETVENKVEIIKKKFAPGLKSLSNLTTDFNTPADKDLDVNIDQPKNSHPDLFG